MHSDCTLSCLQELIDLCKEKEAGAQSTGEEAGNGGGQAAAAMIMRGPDLALVGQELRGQEPLSGLCAAVESTISNPESLP